MQVQGSCHCGNVSYEAEIDPDEVNLCNCTDCQMLLGGHPKPATNDHLKTGHQR
jgi:hypothetical protein